jgi:hypothetical protein
VHRRPIHLIDSIHPIQYLFALGHQLILLGMSGIDFNEVTLGISTMEVTRNRISR